MSEQIKELYYLQDGKCYITGEKLILGKNAGLDHLLPQNKRPDLKNDINNVRWVDKKINEMKRDLTTTEFIDICKKIAKIHNK
jgi:CRISPR/Cas system Type II protein with McrA/HNH and RuvC-like nuclease domain